MDIVGLQTNLARVREDLDNGQTPVPISVRELLRWVGAERRGANVVYEIDQALQQNGIDTQPYFNHSSLDAALVFRLHQEPAAQAEPHGAEEIVGEVNLIAGNAVVAAEGVVAQPLYLGGAMSEPAFRVSRLEAAIRPPVTVAPDCTLEEAMTVMMMRDFSQLPVISGRELKGVVTWSSIAWHLMFDNPKPTAVRQCLKQAVEVKHSDSLFDVIRVIAAESYVLVRGIDNRISGIVTSTDLNLQFQQLSEPFLLLGEIENFVRSLIGGKFTEEQLREIRNPEDQGREVASVADLTLGETIRLLQEPERWERVGLQIDRVSFINELDRVRKIRNDVMHFDPDPISEEDHDALRAFVRFLHQVHRLNH
jgi:CBS domain-containing protein